MGETTTRVGGIATSAGPYPALSGGSTRTRNSVGRREYRRRWCREDVRRKRAAWLQENGPCRLCGSTERLEVDHVDPATKVRTWALARREAELAKCQVLCHTCHLEKTKAQFRRPLVHGTNDGYASHGCRCVWCRVAKRMHHTDYMIRTGQLHKL
jgi:hypothetical protein